MNTTELVSQLARSFKTAARQLKQRHGGRHTLEITDEYDCQDLFHVLLRIFFSDIREEEWVPSYAGGNKRMDFLLPEYRLAIELKHARKSLTAKEVGDELVIDVKNYQTHPNVRHLVCIVFDKEGWIKNPAGIEKDLTKTHDGTLVTRVVIVDY